MPGARIHKLRSGREPDPGRRLLAMRRPSSSIGRLGGGGTSSRGTRGPGAGPQQRQLQAPPTTPTRSTHGARILRSLGGSERDVAFWRSLSKERRMKLKARGGNLRKLVRRKRRQRGLL